MTEWHLEPGAVKVPMLNHIRDGCLASPLVGSSPLMGTFNESRGFAVSFTAPGREQVLERFPYLRAFLELVSRHRPHELLWPWHARLLGRWRRAPNAFYLNVLILGQGTGVGAHVDTTLRELSGVDDARPSAVSVLYLEVPPGLVGGELLLSRGARHLCTVKPTPGTVLHFRGDLRHEVRSLAGEGEQRRISLVCEQYHLPEAGLHRLPRCRVQSMAGFSAYLEAQRGRPPPEGLVLDDP